MSENPTAAVLVIGNEILSGRTRDVNLSYLATKLAEIGIRVAEARVVEDRTEAIVAALDALRAAYTYVFTTGGIGPTHDDITAAAVAEAFGVPLVEDPEARRRLETRYRPEELNPARLRMAAVPQGSLLIDNPVSQSPGFRIGNVFVMAGVPRIMQAMFDGIRHSLKGGPSLIARSITIWVQEGLLAEGLAEVQQAHGAVELGSYPFLREARLGVAVVGRGTDGAAIIRALDAVADVAARLGAPVERE